jgi:hypothetical protein
MKYLSDEKKCFAISLDLNESRAALPRLFIRMHSQQGDRGQMLCFLNIFAETFSEKFALFAQTTVSCCKNCDHNIVFLRKNAIFFSENWQKSQKL